MKRAFCTVCTESHLPYALALYDSLREYDPQSVLRVLQVDGKKPASFEGVTFYHLQDLHPLSEGIEHRWKSDTDRLRWAAKSVFLEYLLEREACAAVIYVDCDISFFDDPSFLFDRLKSSAALLTPHWRGFRPGEPGFELNFKDGFFNAGFFGVSAGGLPAVRWWRACCEYKMEKNYAEGLFDDQRYLDLMPLLFDGISVLEHRGCNVANWNKDSCVRVKSGDRVLINGEWPVVFVHFARSLINDLQRGGDKLLLPYYARYRERLSRRGELGDRGSF